MATPISGGGPNKVTPKNVSYFKRNGKMVKRDQPVSIPPLGRDTAGRINLGLGKGS